MVSHAGKERFHLCLVGQHCAQVFLIRAIRAGSPNWPSRQLFRAAKWLWPHCLLHLCIQSAGEADWALSCCFGGRSLPEGLGKVPRSSVHIPIWLQKADESARDHQLPISAALSLRTWREQATLSCPQHTNVPLCFQCHSAVSYSSLSTVRLLWQPSCIILSNICWFTGERVHFAKMGHHLLSQKLLECLCNGKAAPLLFWGCSFGVQYSPLSVCCKTMYCITSLN